MITKISIKKSIEEHISKINYFLNASEDSLILDFEKHKEIYKFINKEPQQTLWDFKVYSIANLWNELVIFRESLKRDDIPDDEEPSRFRGKLKNH